MGQIINKINKVVFTKKEKKILMLGLDAVGKTSILYKFITNKQVKVNPTIGFNLETIQHQNQSLEIWEISGNLKQLWHHYYQSNQAIIYVIDSSDIDRIDEYKQAIQFVLQNKEMTGIPVLIFANKQDKAKMTISEISDILQLSIIKDIGEWHIQGCCGMNGQGIKEGFDWLVQILQNKQK